MRIDDRDITLETYAPITGTLHVPDITSGRPQHRAATVMAKIFHIPYYVCGAYVGGKFSGMAAGRPQLDLWIPVGLRFLWVCGCAPHGWNLTEISVGPQNRPTQEPKAISTLDCRDPPNFPKVAQSQASFSQAAG
eukprot:COSAG01_NODE_23531_length_811_cov_3.313202_1_plen_135_part_00